MRRRQSLAALATLGTSVGAMLSACTLGTSETDASRNDASPQALATGPYPIAWVLSSGGPRGFVHVGVLKALHALDLRPDLVLGSSVGALVGALYAGGVAPERIEQMALEASLITLFRLNLRPGQSWLSAGGLARLVNEAVGKPLQDFVPAFAAVAVRQPDDTLHALRRGDAGLAVQAACAVEGRLAPVTIAGQTFVDADRISPLPVRLARALGARRVLAIDASAHEALAPPGSEAWRAADLHKRRQTQADAQHADWVLHPEFGYYTGISRDYRLRAIAAGYEQTLQQADSLRSLHGLT